MARTDQHLVVDGSNIATEGRTLPSLSQLDEAVRAITSEYPYESLTVIVDATFAHRIDEAERAEFEAAVLAGEIVTPPAGAIGRGDAFILQVAGKVGAVVFSNDSFQEFHGEHKWLFDEGRLIGGKPIEGVGWIFVERSPVRGPASRRSVREAGSTGGGRRSSKKSRRTIATGPAPKPTKSTPPPAAKDGAAKKNAGGKKKTVAKSTAKAGQGRGKRTQAQPSSGTSTGRKEPEPLNDLVSFMGFVSKYSIGDEVTAVVERFSSHGCYLRAAEAQCYLPSRAMGDPPPTRARDVVSQGQSVIVTVESLDSARRGINVELVRVIPRQETKRTTPGTKRSSDSRTNPANSPHVDANDGDGAEGHLTRSNTNVATSTPRARKRARKATKRTGKKKAVTKTPATATPSARATRAAARKAASKKTAPKKTSANKTVANKTATKAAAKKTTPKKTGAKKKTVAKRPAPKKTANKAAAKKTANKTAVGRTAKKAATKAAAKKTTVNKTAVKRTTKKSAKASAKKTAAKKAPAKAAKKRPARKTTTKTAAKKTAANKTARKTPARKTAGRARARKTAKKR